MSPYTQLIRLLYGLVTLFTVILILQIVIRSMKSKNPDILSGIPDFGFYQLDGTPFTVDSLPKNRPLCLIYMDPGCDYCTKEINDIIRHIDAFGQTTLVLVSMTDLPILRQYAKRARIDTLNGKISILHDRHTRFFDWFGHAVTPTTYLYDRHQRLIRVWRGQVRAETIHRHL